MPVSQGSSSIAAAAAAAATASGPSSTTSSSVRRRVGALTLPQRPDTTWNTFSSSSTSLSGLSAQGSTEGLSNHSAALSSLHNYINRELFGRTHHPNSMRQDQRTLARGPKSFKISEAISDAFHHSERARCQANMFEKLPTEILCTILVYVVEPRDIRPAANDDGDGPKAGNPLQYWYLDRDRCLLRLVCRSWNQTILAMAREINVTLGSDESMNTLLQSLAERKNHGVPPHPLLRASNSTGNATGTRTSTGRRHPSMARRSPRLSGTSTSLSSILGRSSSEWDLSPLQQYVLKGGSKNVVLGQLERRRLSKQLRIPIQGFYNPKAKRTNASSVASGSIPVARVNPWTCPPFISSLSVQGNIPLTTDPKEEVIMSANYSGTQPRPGGGTLDCSTATPTFRICEKEYGSTLDHWLRAAVPKSLTAFSVTLSADFGMSGLLSLPKTLTTLKLIRCPKITGGSLCLGFQHLSNLTSLTICSDIMFTDETFLAALGSLAHLRQLVYIFPCDSVQPAWRDLFRYCSSCELYHRRITTKTYSRELLMPELPQQIQDFVFQMDEPKFQHIRVDTIEQNHHGIDRGENTKFSLSLWKSETKAVEDWCGFDLFPGELRSWWPDNLSRLDLSMASVSYSSFDVPPKLKELVISYPLKPNEIVANGSMDVLDEDKQWFPESLTILEVHGVPYHASCEMQDSANAKVTSWMAYIHKILGMVPRQLEHFTINTYQVPDIEAMEAMRRRVQTCLKTWKVRLLCPQRPKQTGFSLSQLYAPAVLDESNDEEMDYNVEFPDYYSYDDSDADMDSNTSYDSEADEHSDIAMYNSGRAAVRQFAETVTAEQYDVTPIMLRNAIKGMRVLEKLEVEVNYQHYRYCCALWKGNLGLSEPLVSSGTGSGPGSESTKMGNMKMTDRTLNGQGKMGDEEEGESDDAEENDGVFEPKVSAVVDGMHRKGKGTATATSTLTRASPSTFDVKGKGKKIENDEKTESNREGCVQVDLMGHSKGGVRPKTEIRYWSNSCCGKRCLGWIRTQN